MRQTFLSLESFSLQDAQESVLPVTMSVSLPWVFAGVFQCDCLELQLLPDIPFDQLESTENIKMLHLAASPVEQLCSLQLEEDQKGGSAGISVIEGNSDLPS